ncbi:folylpolyglutamate synthase [Penicillium malachiteum]|uniref:folylpolyglutamate synthase n=1 Tax=Penicillium malachiteum TaxID=1324776 RepID=UPI0025495C05|nr:folylpolyglutamate synthase [Penicillium malachiteum]KAJ5714321.1 folylpolyglutamate synthase [Penicillium malachiteum]
MPPWLCREYLQQFFTATFESSLKYVSQTSDLNRLNIVHVAGTKSKGTTCAFVNSIHQQYHKSHETPRENWTLYLTSPCCLWNALESSAIQEGLDPAVKPTYF